MPRRLGISARLRPVKYQFDSNLTEYISPRACSAFEYLTKAFLNGSIKRLPSSIMGLRLRGAGRSSEPKISWNHLRNVTDGNGFL